MMIYECLMGATRVSIPLKHFNGVPNRENYTSDMDPRHLSVQCRRPHHPPDGCLITWKPLSNISESHGMEGSVSHALLSYDFEAAVFLDSSFCGHDPRCHVFSSDKLKSRTLFLPPRPPPSAPRRPQTDLCWDGERTPPPARDHCRRRGRCRTVPAPKDSHRHYAHARSQAGGPPLTCAGPLSPTSPGRLARLSILVKPGPDTSANPPNLNELGRIHHTSWEPRAPGGRSVCLFAPRRPCAAGSCR